MTKTLLLSILASALSSPARENEHPIQINIPLASALSSPARENQHPLKLGHDLRDEKHLHWLPESFSQWQKRQLMINKKKYPQLKDVRVGKLDWIHLGILYWVEYCGCLIFMIFSQFDDEDAHTSSLTSQVREFLIKLRKWLCFSSPIFIRSIAGASGDHKFTVERRLLLHEGNNASWHTNRRSRNPWRIETDWEQWQGCIQTAADLLDKLDETADPCDDFYQFACGSFIEETVIPDDRTRTSMFSILGDKLDVQVRGLLEGEIKASDPKPFQMAKSVFQSCMDKETIEVKKNNVLSLKTICVSRRRGLSRWRRFWKSSAGGRCSRGRPGTRRDTSGELAEYNLMRKYGRQYMKL